MGNSFYQTQSKGFCFSGGGVLLPCHAGVICALDFKDVTHFSGASAGSIAASLASFRTAHEKIKSSLLVDFSSFLDDDYGVVRDTYRLWTEAGYYKGDLLLSYLSNLFIEITGSDLTFKESYEKYGTHLTIPITKVYKSHCVTEYCSHTTSPDQKISYICRLSCTYPLLFRSVDWYSDGGILDNCPIECLGSDLKFGVCFVSKFESTDPPENVYQYSASIIASLHEKLNEKCANNILHIPVDISSTDFNISEEKKLELFELGGSLAKNHFILSL